VLAKTKLGQAYYFGHGVEVNPKKAKTYFHEAATAGSSEASTWLSILQNLNAENPDELLHYKVQNEEAAILYKQAMGMLYKGSVRDFDIREGLHRLRESASREYTPALKELGKICERSLFGCDNMVEASEWYKQAALLGDVYAQYHLAEIYYLGLGVDQDYVSSFVFAVLAARQNNEEALELQTELEAKLSDDEYHEARVLLEQFDNL
jgi:uncharacterized protein